MEETQPISKNESFSYNWLMTMKKPVKYVDSSSDSLRFTLDDEADHSKVSMRCTERSSFHFDLSGAGPTDISVADQMIRNGSLVPLDHINKQDKENESNVILEDSATIQQCLTDTSEMLRMQHRHVASNHHIMPNSSPIGSPVDILRDSYNRSVVKGAKSKSHSFGRMKKPSKKINIYKYIKSLVHFCKKVKEFGFDEARRVSTRSSDDAAFRSKSCCSSPLYDAGREHAIREAILHCKSSSRKNMENFAVDGDEEINK